MSASDPPSVPAVRDYLLGLQDRICTALEREDGSARFSRETTESRDTAGLARPRVIEGGEVIEKAAVNFSHTVGKRLPSAATERRPELAGQGFEAVSVSLIVHPRNPYAPTSHANFRFFSTDGQRSDGGDDSDSAERVWWFGGGYDLTPYYGFKDDAVHWHRTAQAACQPFGAEIYPRFKKACDEYFFLPHRNESRGIGGLFFDDHAAGGFAQSFALVRSLGDSFIGAYLPILARRKSIDYGERERDFQLYRRGRYVEFNLLYDRGTRFGLQSGKRIESVLASLPPEVRWRYDWQPSPGSTESQLYATFLGPRDWLGLDEAAGSHC